MKSNVTILIIALLVVLVSGSVLAQRTGDYRSNGSGNWGDNTLWLRYNGSAWAATGSAPTGSGTITLQGTDSLYLNVNVTITDTLKSTGGKLGNTSVGLTMAGGSVYDHAVNNGSIPVCTWNDSSTCLITGYQSGSKPNNLNQNFYNLKWECATQGSNVDMSMSGNTIRGDVFITNTASVRVYLTSPNPYTAPITINGNIYQTAGAFSSNGSGSPDTIIINSMGDIIVTGGNFGTSRGSATDVTWNVFGDFSVTNATLQNSGSNPRTQQLVFAGTGVQNLTLTNVAYGSGSAPFTMRVKNGSTLNMGVYEIGSSNTGSFIVEPGATLQTAHIGGLNGSIQCTGNTGPGIVLSKEGHYVFNGTSAQITGSLLPDTVGSLTINNTAGVTLTSSVVITDTLHLVAGVFDNTISCSLGPNGVVSMEGGSILNPLAVGDEETLPGQFKLSQNYPNPFNPATTISYTIPASGMVTLKVYSMLGTEVATLVSAQQPAGEYRVQWNASAQPSGVYMYKLTTGNRSEVKKMLLTK